jgi:hypothetical protein
MICEHPECSVVHIDWVELRRGERSIQAPLRFRRYLCRLDPTTGTALEAADPQLMEQDRQDADRIWFEKWGEPMPARPVHTTPAFVQLRLPQQDVQVLDAKRGSRSREAYIGELLRKAG